MPDWHEDAEETALGRRWPLRLLTAPGYFQSHTAFSGNPALRRREGAPVVILHPAEAGRRGLPPDDGVELFNDLGTRVACASASPTRSRRESCWFPGSGPAGEALSGTINLLCSDRLTDLGEGATYQSTFLDVRRAARA